MRLASTFGPRVRRVCLTMASQRGGRPPRVARVERGRDRVLDEVVQRLGLEVVAPVGILDAVGRRDRPAVLAVEPLVPPPVEDRQVESAVQGGLHARRATGLQRADRVVQPHVAAGVQRRRHRDVVVRQEHDAVTHVLGVREVHQLLDEPLAAVVSRVRLAGDHELHGALGIGEQGPQPLGIAQHEGEPLVRRHAAGEADREDVGIEHRVDPAELGIGRAAVDPGLAQAACGSCRPAPAAARA